jgi:dihydroneopterin aldolase
MQKIQLIGLEFFSYHGVYDYEKKEGNKFLVDITVNRSIKEVQNNDNLAETVDYESLYKIAAEVMTGSVNLIETIAANLLERVSSSFPFVDSLEVSIAKLNPPIGAVCREARITMSKEHKIG